MVYIGVDLHRKTTQVASVNGGGELLVKARKGRGGSAQLTERLESDDSVLVDV